MLLLTLGGLSLETYGGVGPVPALGPRRLALLAVVAAAGPNGITREKILGILWADKDEEQARHTLSQTLYLLRRETGTACIAGTHRLRLDPALANDLRDFQQALKDDRLEQAVALYAGPFLEGFYLSGAPEFERWVEVTRARLQNALARALETLARRAVEAGSMGDAAGWWHRLHEIDPFNAAWAAGRIRALIATDDDVEALRFAREYESRVRRELDAEPNPAILELIGRLRSTAAALPPAPPAGPLPPPAVAGPPQAIVSLPTKPATPGTRVRSRRLVPMLLLAGLATAAVAWRIAGTPRAPDDARSPVDGGSHSAVARALYEQGLRALYNADLAGSRQLMEAALREDSTYAMAAAHAWRSSLALGRVDDANRLLPIARRLAARATDRERLLIEGMIADQAGAPLSELVSLARQLTDRHPGDADGQILLGRAMFAAGDWPGAVAALERAVAIDSAAGAPGETVCRVCDALYRMAEAYSWWDSIAAAERTGRRLIALRPGDGSGWSTAVESLLRQGRRADAEAAIASIARLNPGIYVDFSGLMDRDLIRSGRSDELEARVVTELRAATPEERGEMPWLLAIALRTQGRLREAENLATDGALPDDHGRIAGHHDLVTLAIAALEAGRPREAALRFLDMVAADRVRDEGAGFRARNISWHMTLAGTALAAAGDTAAVRALADSVERIGPASSFGRDARLPHFLRGLILQQQNRHAEAIEAFRRSLFSLTDGYTRINLELARSLVALGRYAEAVAVLQPALRGGVDGANTYLTQTELHEALGGAFYAAGQRDSAAVHYAAVERAWRRADAVFAARYRLARDRAGPRIGG